MRNNLICHNIDFTIPRDIMFESYKRPSSMDYNYLTFTIGLKIHLARYDMIPDAFTPHMAHYPSYLIIDYEYQK